jgi:hypothetical protein
MNDLDDLRVRTEKAELQARLIEAQVRLAEAKAERDVLLKREPDKTKS